MHGMMREINALCNAAVERVKVQKVYCRQYSITYKYDVLY